MKNKNKPTATLAAPLVRGHHWFICGLCLGGMIVNAVHTPTVVYEPPAQVVQAAPTTPSIHALLASMPLHIRTTATTIPPTPKRKPALAEAGLL